MTNNQNQSRFYKLETEDDAFVVLMPDGSSERVPFDCYSKVFRENGDGILVPIIASVTILRPDEIIARCTGVSSVDDLNATQNQ